MQTIALEQLDPSVRQWLGAAGLNETFVVTERDVPVLTLRITPPLKSDCGGTMERRVLRPGFAELMKRPMGGTGITEILEQDREDRW